MPSITIRDVPDDTRDELAARARRSGRSLQEFLRAELIELADKPDPAEVRARVRARREHATADVSPERILEHLRADRG
jgi:plasmid stability protein